MKTINKQLFKILFLLFFAMSTNKCFGDSTQSWKIGGKIHFEEQGSKDYIGIIEVNKVTRETLKEFFDVKIDICDSNAKIFLKKEKTIISSITMKRESNLDLAKRCTLRYFIRGKRVENGHETLNDVIDNSTLSSKPFSPTQVKLNVPYISQNDHKSCATTSLAMAISYYEKRNDQPLDKETVWQISGTDEQTVYQYGNDMDGLKRIANHYVYKSEFREQMTISDFELLLAKEALVVINIRQKPEGTASHAVFVTGYDKIQQIFYINDPTAHHKKLIHYSDLMPIWSAYLSSPMGLSQQSGFIIYPKKSETKS